MNKLLDELSGLTKLIMARGYSQQEITILELKHALVLLEMAALRIQIVINEQVYKDLIRRKL